MDSSFSASWLRQGYFDFSAQEGRHTTAQEIKAVLSASLGLPRDGLRIFRYPVGPNWKHIIWWREGKIDYAEAQFFAEVSATHPVLSLGVAVEKGLDQAASRPEELMDRATWDWQRLVAHAHDLLANDVAIAAAALGTPVNLRIRTKRRLETDSQVGWKTRTFSFADGLWFERHVGPVGADVIISFIQEIDAIQDLWAIVHFAHDLGPTETAGLAPEAAASLLLRFSQIRRRLRPTA